MKDYEAIIALQQTEIDRLKKQLQEVYSITASEAEAFADRVTAIIEDMGCYSKYGALI